MIFMLSKPGGKKKTEGLQYPRVPFEPREKHKSRDSCLVIREKHLVGLGSLQKKCLTARFFSSRGRSIQTGNIRMSVNPA